MREIVKQQQESKSLLRKIVDFVKSPLRFLKQRFKENKEKELKTIEEQMIEKQLELEKLKEEQSRLTYEMLELKNALDELKRMQNFEQSRQKTLYDKLKEIEKKRRNNDGPSLSL